MAVPFPTEFCVNWGITDPIGVTCQKEQVHDEADHPTVENVFHHSPPSLRLHKALVERFTDLLLLV